MALRTVSDRPQRVELFVLRRRIERGRGQCRGDGRRRSWRRVPAAGGGQQRAPAAWQRAEAGHCTFFAVSRGSFRSAFLAYDRRRDARGAWLGRVSSTMMLRRLSGRPRSSAARPAGNAEICSKRSPIRHRAAAGPRACPAAAARARDGLRLIEGNQRAPVRQRTRTTPVRRSSVRLGCDQDHGLAAERGELRGRVRRLGELGLRQSHDRAAQVGIDAGERLDARARATSASRRGKARRISAGGRGA